MAVRAEPRYSPFREELKRAWRELRGSRQTPTRIAWAVFAGLFIGSLPIFGCHTPLVLGLCIWFHFDGALAWVAANISNPFFAPALLTLEVEVGSYLRTGSFTKPPHAVAIGEIGRFAGDLFLGAPFVALAVAVVGACLAFGVARFARWLRPNTEAPEPYRLPENAPPWVKAVERVAMRYAALGLHTARDRTRFQYVRTKLLGDPVARMIADLEGDSAGALGAVCDVGTGRGQLPVLLLELGRATEASGFDWDATKVEEGREAAAREPALSAVFSQGDARTTELPRVDTALLIDVLHYVDVAAQDAMLDRAANAVRPGGRVVVREADTERGVRSLLTLLEERFFTFVRFNRGERVCFRPAREIAARLASHGLTCDVRPAWGMAPFSNVLVVARRPLDPLSGLKELFSSQRALQSRPESRSKGLRVPAFFHGSSTAWLWLAGCTTSRESARPLRAAQHLRLALDQLLAPSAPAPTSRGRRIAVRASHYLAAILSAGLVPVAVIALDHKARAQALKRDGGSTTYWLVWALGYALWLMLLECARHPRRAVRVAGYAILVTTAAFGIGGQAFFHQVSLDYVDRNAIMLALAARDVVFAYLQEDVGRFVLYLLVPAVGVALLALIRARALGPTTQSFAIPAVTLVLFLGILLAPLKPRGWGQKLSPDMLWLNALGAPVLWAAGLESAPRTLPRGKHQAVPALEPVSGTAPSIIVLFGESVRRDAMCPPSDASCDTSLELDAAAPDRFLFSHASAIASCTEISSVAIWTGRPVNSLVEEIAEAPLLFDYAKARGYRTAYLSSQNLAYQHLDAYLDTSRIDKSREARQRSNPGSFKNGSPDEVTLREAVSYLDPVRPSFVFVHLSNTHMPYRQEKGYLRFTSNRIVGVSANPKGRYRNAELFENQILGQFLLNLRRTEAGRQAVVLYISDHAEAFNEHGARGHTSSVYAEQLDVPLFIDAPAGSIDEKAMAQLRADAPSRFVTTQDVSATVIDLLGGLDEPAWQPLVSQLAGASLLRPAPEKRTVLIANCPLFRECQHLAYGEIAWPLKFHYEGRQGKQVCSNLEEDPEEQSPLPSAACHDLEDNVKAAFEGRIGDQRR